MGSVRVPSPAGAGFPAGWGFWWLLWSVFPRMGMEWGMECPPQRYFNLKFCVELCILGHQGGSNGEVSAFRLTS